MKAYRCYFKGETWGWSSTKCFMQVNKPCGEVWQRALSSDEAWSVLFHLTSNIYTTVEQAQTKEVKDFFSEHEKISKEYNIKMLHLGIENIPLYRLPCIPILNVYIWCFLVTFHHLACKPKDFMSQLILMNIFVYKCPWKQWVCACVHKWVWRWHVARWTSLQSRWQFFLRLDRYFTKGKSVTGMGKGMLPESLRHHEHTT